MLLKIENNRAVLKTSMSPRMSALLSQMEGQRRWLNEGGLSFEPTEHNISIFRNAIPELVIDRPDTLINTENLTAHAAFDADRIETTYTPRTASYAHQERAISLALQNRHFGLFMEQGTGKTKVAIDVASTRFLKGEITGILVISPKGVHRQWIESQIPTHCGIKTNCVFWPLPTTQRAVPPVLLPSRDAMAVFSLNIDAIRSDRAAELCAAYINAHKGRILMIVDESHLIKNHTTHRWIAANRLGKLCAYRMIMTGTPIAKDLSDEWAQMKWLDETIVGIRYITAFRNTYCLMGGFEGREVIGHRNLVQFRKKVDPFTFRATKDEIGILPKLYDQWKFDLTIQQKKMIASIKEDLIASISSGQITTASNAALKIMRIQQISNGFIVNEDGGAHLIFENLIQNPRIIALLEFLQSREGKVIIWCRFVQDILMVKEAIGDDAVVYYGAVSDNDRQAAVKAFLADDGPRCFVANPATGGTGLNLQGNCRTVVYFSNSDNSIERWQSEDRTHRIGTVGSVVYTDLIAKGSTDLRILANLRRKKGVSDMVLGEIQNWLKQDWEKEEILSDINCGNF
jgi:hypothetical protein